MNCKTTPMEPQMPVVQHQDGGQNEDSLSAKEASQLADMMKYYEVETDTPTSCGVDCPKTLPTGDEPEYGGQSTPSLPSCLSPRDSLPHEINTVEENLDSDPGSKIQVSLNGLV